MRAKADDPSALHVVLFQEVERYNALLLAIRRSCTELQRGIRGLVVMSADLDAVFDALYNGRVPAAWLKAYPSVKGLGPWTRDLLLRIEQLARWAAGRCVCAGLNGALQSPMTAACQCQHVLRATWCGTWGLRVPTA